MSEQPDYYKFIFIVGGDVAFRLILPNSVLLPRQRAALNSNPVIMEVDMDNPVDTGWTYDGTNFHPPA